VQQGASEDKQAVPSGKGNLSAAKMLSAAARDYKAIGPSNLILRAVSFEDGKLRGS
jgi:hypothetical protein